MPQAATPPESGDVPESVEETAPVVIAWSMPSYQGFVTTTAIVAGTIEAPEDATVRISVLRGAAWEPLAVEVTRAADTFSATIPITAAQVQIRAEVVDSGEMVAASTPSTLTGLKARSALTLSMPSKVVDYRTVDVTAGWRTEDGRSPSGTIDLMFKKKDAKSYSLYRRLTLTDGAGRAAITPRNDGSFKLTFVGSESLLASSSSASSINNLPPGKAVVIPKGASRPSIKLPAQARAERVEADAEISTLSDAVWKSMVGRSWHRGCPVGRSSLRVVRVSYWGFDGYVRRGEIVVAQKHSAATARVFTDLFERRTPIRSMYRVDRFGWSKKLRGADDYKSMRADNTSGFNCRGVVGAPHRRSPHSTGRSIDINPWENPYASPKGWTPNGSWHKRTSPTSVTWRGRNDPVVKIFRKHGFRWLGGFDLHHFER